MGIRPRKQKDTMIDEQENTNDNETGTEQVADIVADKEISGENRDELGRFIPGASGNPEGRPTLTEEEKIAKRATKELIEQYKNKLAEALPQVSPVLIAMAIQGDIQAIKELNDRVMGKAKQAIVGGDENDEPIKVEYGWSE